MNWLSFHVASGASLFSGAGLLIAGVLFASKSKGRIRFLFKLTVCLGVALILLSSTPFPSWAYWLFVFLCFAWIILESTTRFSSFPGNIVSRALLIACSLVMAIVEIPQQRLGPLPSGKHSQLYIIGDSISAGIDENPNWVEVFRGRYGGKVNNLAKPAATLGSALKQSELLSSEDGVILLEIGGNDMLGKTSPVDFRKELEQLLVALNKPGRILVMLELPLLPGQAALGRSQRSLAKQYGVYLIPKRYFCQVLSAPNATLDGLHLSPTGSPLMADMIHATIGGMLVQKPPSP